MKPDWKDAPEWAQWLAMDKDGVWYWHEKKPIDMEEEWWSSGHYAPASRRWNNTDEPRPGSQE